MNRTACRAALWLCTAFVSATLVGCGNDNVASIPKAPNKDDTGSNMDTDVRMSADQAQPANADPCGTGKFDSTFAAIQKVIFEGRNCTNSMCHGAAAMGGLDLRVGVSYQNLVEVRSRNSALFRIMPGQPNESFLFNKLRAATEPGSVQVEGSPMPNGSTPLSPDHLEAVRRWIEQGAPREGSIGDSTTGQSDAIAKLLGSCLPDATPIAIKPLEAPALNEGIQFVMAPFILNAQKEVDVCFAQYYDFSAVVPAEFQDPERGVFFVNGRRTRQDPNSHHLRVSHSKLGAESVNDPSFGQWSCRGDDGNGAPCDPLQSGVCGSGVCASALQAKSACLGFGPPGAANIIAGGEINTSTTTQYYQPPRDGVYEEIPLEGILYWNSHAFNLTNEDTRMHAWINMLYATDRRYKLDTRPIADHLGIAAGQPPFTKRHYCASWVAPQHSALYMLLSHTHKRGRDFTVDLFDGTRIYTSLIYSDPVLKVFDPGMRFDSADTAERTLTYCADFNNGVNDDGSPDIDLVTRLSTMPDRTTCRPVACVAGQIGAPCAGADDDGSCDSSPGAGDGWCDACQITAGQTTENEMFSIVPSIVGQ
jgi:hypothetical protein